MNTITSILERVKTAPSLDFGEIFSNSIELFKKTWVQGFLLQLFSVLIMLPFIILIYVPFIMAMVAQVQADGANPDSMEAFNAVFAGFSLLFIVLIFVGMLVLSVVTLALQSGFYRIMKMLDHDEQVTTADFFYFVKGNHLSKLFVLMLASLVISIIAALLCFIPIIYVMVPMSFFTMFFAFNPELSVSDIIKGSFALGNKKWLLVFGLIIVSSLLAEIVGLLLCGVGVFFTAAFVYHPTYLVYKNVIGFNNDDKPVNHIVE